MAYNRELYTLPGSALDAGIIYDQTEEKMQSEINAEVKNSYLPLTAGSDKPLTGNLTIQNSPIYIKNTSADVSAQSDTQDRSWNIICSDKNNVASGVFDSYFRGSDGYVYVELQGRRLVDGNTVTNYLRLGVQPNGTKQVSVSNGAIWREALGLGTSGALPITVAQGGTGQTAIQYYNTAADLFTAASGVTILGVSGALWGKVLSINIAARKTTAVTTASDFSIGTVVAGKRPRVTSNIGISGGNITTGNIDGNGNVNLHGTVTANGNLYIFATYVIW